MTQDEERDGQSRRIVFTRSNEKYSPEKIIEALKATRGMIATAARVLGCSRQTIYESIARHPEINAVVAGERDLMLDTAELRLMEAVEAGESWAVKFFLTTQGQVRGYIERPQKQEEDNTIRVFIEPSPKARRLQELEERKDLCSPPTCVVIPPDSEEPNP